jgi:hypothetical protein
MPAYRRAGSSRVMIVTDSVRIAAPKTVTIMCSIFAVCH